MVISNTNAANAAPQAQQQQQQHTPNTAHPSGIPQDQIDNIMSGIANTGDVRMNNHRKKLKQRFDIIKKLGQGTYGKVQLGLNKETGQEVAIKTIKKCKIEAEADLVRIRREVQIMSSVQHPNIIHIYEVFENREKMVLVMEFAAGGELYDYLSERKVLNEEEARRIFRQVATAVYYCHKHKICHRDLKLENILLDEKGNAKIADFGLSNVFDEQRLLQTFCGSPLYASPEIVEGTPYQGPEVDCWSLGVLLYTLVYGSMPFDGSNFKRLVKQISQGDYYEPKQPSRASSLIRAMLTVCPRKRATIEQICSHWWVNENDNISCLDLAEDLANQTPVRLDVLLSVTPSAVTADQLVVPSADGKQSERIARSHSDGSIRDLATATTEAEQRIMDMVAAGGEAALMPSPTRTITPAQSPVQSKRKLETTISTDNAVGFKKKEKPGSGVFKVDDLIPQTVSEANEESPMEVESSPQSVIEKSTILSSATASNVPQPQQFEQISEICDQLLDNENNQQSTETPTGSENEPLNDLAKLGETAASLANQKTENIQEAQSSNQSDNKAADQAKEGKEAAKVIKKFVNKHKTADLVNAIGQVATEGTPNVNEKTTTNQHQSSPTKTASAAFVRKCSLQDETALNKFNNDRRKSRIIETAEKFQQMNNTTITTPISNVSNAEKPKKIVIPGVSVGSFKKEFEKKASAPPVTTGLTPGEKRALEEIAQAKAAALESEMTALTVGNVAKVATTPPSPSSTNNSTNVENSDSKSSVTSVSLEDARRSMENSIALLRQAQDESSKEVDQLCAKTADIGVNDVPPEREKKLKAARAIIGNAIQPVADADAVKTSSASITLKSATLPRRKPLGNKTEIQLEIKPRAVEQPAIRFTTEMQHPIQDLRSAPPREGPMPFTPPIKSFNNRATSLEPKEHIVPMQKPPAYTRTISNTTTRSGSLSRQSTADSETESNATTFSQATLASSSQPIKKSPREFIIPIAVEGGGIITPREGSIEPSDSSHTATSSRSTFSRIRPSRRIGSSLINDRTASSLTREGGDDDNRFGLQRLRSSRPAKKISQDNDEESSDDDVFEALTAEKLFSTLLQRVRAVTNRFNANNNFVTSFPNSSRLLNNIRDGQSTFWNQDPFISTRSNPATGINNAPWSHSMARDLDSDMDSIFSRSGATLPRDDILSRTNLASVAVNSNITPKLISNPKSPSQSHATTININKFQTIKSTNLKPDTPSSTSLSPFASLLNNYARTKPSATTSTTECFSTNATIKDTPNLTETTETVTTIINNIPITTTITTKTLKTTSPTSQPHITQINNQTYNIKTLLNTNL